MVSHKGSVTSDFEEIGADAIGSWRWTTSASNEVLTAYNNPSRNRICEAVVDQETISKPTTTTSCRDSRDIRPPSFFRQFKLKETPPRFDPTNRSSGGQFFKSKPCDGSPGQSNSYTVVSNEADESDSHDKVKTKLLSVWNNMKYGKNVLTIYHQDCEFRVLEA